MLILAVDSTTPVAGVALVDEEKVIAEYFSNYKRVHSENLLPVIDRILTDCNCHLQDLTAIAVTTGPGSFTGIRIGMATVKGLSLGSGIPLISISTLDAIACNVIFSNYLACPVLNARKNEVYAALYDVRGAMPDLIWGPVAGAPEIIADKALKAAADREGIIMLGDGYFPFKQCFQEKLGDKLAVAPSHLMLPRAASIGTLARQKINQEKFEDVHSIRPYYIRLSEAEYKLGKEC